MIGLGSDKNMHMHIEVKLERFETSFVKSSNARQVVEAIGKCARDPERQQLRKFDSIRKHH